ncbi:MAG: protein kinase [bacterium]|nr:protein kinase [bacterium]
MIGTTIGPYKVEALLGAGGMGEVYRADDSRLGRQVALKFLPPAMQDDPERRARLRREAQAAARLHSPSIAATHDIGEVDGSLFIVMEYVEGETLSRRLEGGPLSLPRAVRWAMQIADALDEAHALGILHRDIKSANLMITARGRIKVLDFGLTKFVDSALHGNHRATSAITLDEPTAAGVLMGTVSYMSPEQALGREVDHRSDLFSLGVVMYEMATGKLPFVGNTALAISNAVLNTAPAPMGLGPGEASAAWERIVGKCLEKAPEARYQSAREVYDELRLLRRGLDAEEYIESSGPVSGMAGASALTDRPGDSSLRSLGAGSGAVPHVVAVMPFGNITRQETDEWIGTGIAETVTADLKAIPGLSVAGSERVFEVMQEAGAGREFDERIAIDLGRRLGAAWIVIGGYQRMGEVLRITARTVDMGSGTVVKTVKADGPTAEIFDLQDRVVRELGQDFNRALGHSSVGAVERAYVPPVEAFECFSRGTIRFRTASRDSIDEAILLFEQAAEIDPGYAQAWAGLAAAYGIKGGSLSLPKLFDKAMRAGRRAVELDPLLPQAHQWLGSAYNNLGEEGRAIEHLEQAVRLDPTNSIAHILLSRVLWLRQGRLEEALEAAERARRLSPESGNVQMQLGLLYTLLGRYDEAEAASRKAAELQKRTTFGFDEMRTVGAHMRLGYVHYRQGRWDEAIDAYRRERADLEARRDHALSERTAIELRQKLGAALLRGGRAEEGKRQLTRAIESYRQHRETGADDPFTQYYVACAHALLGDSERAVRYFTASSKQLDAYNRRRGATDPDLESVREQLAAAGLIRSAG